MTGPGGQRREPAEHGDDAVAQPLVEVDDGGVGLPGHLNRRVVEARGALRRRGDLGDGGVVGRAAVQPRLHPGGDRVGPVRGDLDLAERRHAARVLGQGPGAPPADPCSTVIEGGRPGRGSSQSPSRRSVTNRARHLPTVAGAQPSRAATVLLSAPSAQASTIFDRSANACADLARRDQRTSCSRSPSLSTNSALGRPVLAISKSMTYIADFRRRTLMRFGLTPIPGSNPGASAPHNCTARTRSSTDRASDYGSEG